MTLAAGKVKETEFGRYVQHLMYAACADVERDLYAESKYDKYIYYSYESILKYKKDRLEGLKHRFSVNDGAKQLFAYIFDKFIEELNAIKITDKDTIATLREEISGSVDDSYFDFMCMMNDRIRHTFGSNLTTARDVTEWFRGQIIANLKHYASNDKIISMIYVEFNTFLKSVALIMTKQWWYSGKTIDDGALAGTFFALGMNAYMSSDLTGCLRVKPPTKPKTTKTTKKTTATTESVISTIAGEVTEMVFEDTASDITANTTNTCASESAIIPNAVIDNAQLDDILSVI